LQTKNPGFNKENVAIITMPKDADSTRLESFKNALLQNHDVSYVAAASSVPGDKIPVNLVNDGGTDFSKAVSVQMLFTDVDFVRAMQMQVVAGRTFDKSVATDKTMGFVINEEAVKKLGWKDAPGAIGKTIQWVQPASVIKEGRVIGVVKDFNITPLRSAVQPLVMHYRVPGFQYLYLRFNQNNARAILADAQKQFAKFYPNQSFEYSFLDDTLNKMYQSERKLSSVFSYSSLLAILIACMGVLGLSIYSIQQRIKEIGIRKVLGASVFTITKDLIKEFAMPVIVASLVASPIAWYAMDQWLQDFAYHIKIEWTIFLLVTIVVLTLAVLTMSVQSIKAATANPVDSLRTE